MSTLRALYEDHIEGLVDQVKGYVPTSTTGRAMLVGMSAGVVVYLLTRTRYKLPPGPRGWPLLGNILDFRDKTIYEKLIEWKEKYGPIITFRAGLDVMVALNSTEAIYEAFVKKQSDFAGRPQSSYSMNIMTDGGKSLAMGDYGPSWKLHRRLASKALRQYLRGTSLEDGVEKTLIVGTKLLRKQTGPFNPSEILSLITFNTINSICFGFTCDIDDAYFVNLTRILDDFVNILGNGFLEDFIPPLRLFPTKNLRKLIKATNEFIACIDENIAKHKQTFSKDVTRDFCDAIILAQMQAQEEGDSELIGDIYGGGLDTSRMTLLWSFLYLAQNKDVQEKMHKEIDAALGERIYPKLSDRVNLVYCEAVLHEVLRISSASPLALPHTATCDTRVGGYDIPKGTTVLPNLHAVHHDPNVWRDPEVFRPERFLDSNGKMAPKPDSWLPFSAGRRVCLGEPVAKPQLHLILVGILRQFSMSLPLGAKVDTKLKGGAFANNPNDFEVVLQPRA